MRIFQSAGLALEILPCTTIYRPATYLGMNGQIIRRIDPSPEPFPLYWPPNHLFDQPHIKALTEFTIEVGETICMRDPITATDRDKRLKADPDSSHMVTIRQNLIPNPLDGLIDLSPAGSPIKPAGGLFCQPLVRTLSGEDKAMDNAVT